MVGTIMDSWERFGNAVLRHRQPVVALVDAALWAFVLPLAWIIRVEFEFERINWSTLLAGIAIAVVVQLVTGYATGLYRGKRKLASFEEVGWVALNAGVVVVALFLAIWVTPGKHLIPRSAILAAGAYQIMGSLAFRFVIRIMVENRRKSSHVRNARLLVFGAGQGGEEVVRAVREDSESDLEPVAFLDDDPSKARLRLLGLPIAGGREAIADAKERFDASVLLIAMPSASHETVLEIADVGQSAGLDVRILPRMDRFVTEAVAVRDIRQVTLADFLSRDEVRLDLDAIAGYVQGKTVLVTGAGGSIGSQLCETLRGFAPGRLLMLDHAENNLHALILRLEGRAHLDSPDLVLADIRDAAAMQQVMRKFRPDVVFHAAAHKHVTFLENHPAEGVKTNVLGTRNVLQAALDHGVERFVNVSTDKAADAVNVLGLTKRLGERLTAHYAMLGDGVYMSVRFGNVLGSDGSVIPTFREQLANGEPITVTHPDVTRFFMTIPEAVQLVVEAGAVGGDGEVLVLEMGEPVKILDLAYRLAAEITPGKPPEVVFTGLKPGEKLHETLESADDEKLDQPHELLWRYCVPPIEASTVDTLAGVEDDLHVVELLEKLVVAEMDPVQAP